MTAALRAQEVHLSQQDFQTAMATQLSHLTSQVRDLLDHLHQTASPPTALEPPAAAAAPAQPVPCVGPAIRLACPE